MNKDEADRCIQIAIDAFKSGNIDRSEKFLRKAENLFPSQRAKGNINANDTVGPLIQSFLSNRRSTKSSAQFKKFHNWCRIDCQKP